MTDEYADTVRSDMRAAGVLDHGWPYGAAGRDNGNVRNRLLSWTRDGEWRLERPRRRCLHWIAGQGRRCASMPLHRHTGSLLDPELHEALDHVTFWSRRGRPALILAQPYVLHYDVLDRVAATWDLDVVTFDDNPWYGYGTKSVFITPFG